MEEFPESKDVRVTKIGAQSYFVSISQDGVGVILGKCTVSNETFGVANITLDQIKEIYNAPNDQLILHLNFTEEEKRFIKTEVTEKGYQKLFNNLIN